MSLTFTVLRIAPLMMIFSPRMVLVTHSAADLCTIVWKDIMIDAELEGLARDRNLQLDENQLQSMKAV